TCTRRGRDGGALELDFARRVHQTEGGVEVVALAGRVAADLYELIDQALLDGDVEPIVRRSRIAAAGRGEDQLVADLLADATGNGIDLDAGHHVGELLPAGGGAAVERLEAAAGKRASRDGHRYGESKTKPRHLSPPVALRPPFLFYVPRWRARHCRALTPQLQYLLSRRPAQSSIRPAVCR